MTTVQSFFELRAPGSIDAPCDISGEFPAVASKELIGIEVEVENVGRVRSGVNAVWQQINDGSLRNDGREYITMPVPAAYAPDLLHNLMRVGLRQECSFSPRTSVHVHLNMQDVELEQVGDLLLLYTLFERTLFRFVGRNRARNPYCVPIAETGLLGNFVQEGIRGRWEKYAGFNLLPLRDKGTVEFRHMHGTSDVVKLSRWIDLVTQLKEYVKKNKTKSIRQMLANLSKDEVPALMKEVFGASSEYLKWNSVDEFEPSILMTKYAMANRTNITNLRGAVNSSSAFFQVKD